MTGRNIPGSDPGFISRPKPAMQSARSTESHGQIQPPTGEPGGSGPKGVDFFQSHDGSPWEIPGLFIPTFTIHFLVHVGTHTHGSYGRPKGTNYHEKTRGFPSFFFAAISAIYFWRLKKPPYFSMGCGGCKGRASPSLPNTSSGLVFGSRGLVVEVLKGQLFKTQTETIDRQIFVLRFLGNLPHVSAWEWGKNAKFDSKKHLFPSKIWSRCLLAAC